MKYFETHAHYNDEAYKDDIEEVLKRYNLGEKDIISEYEKLCD